MRFNLVINLERMSPDEDLREVMRHVTEMVQMADEGGFDIVWAAEHHAIEMTIAPGPFQLLAHFAAHTSRIRLGTAVVVAPYWHPVKLAGEAALFDLLSGGRLELGIGKGAYQREFDRMASGMEMNLGVPMMQEMLPVLKALWRGDYEHNGEYWSFPTATACPKPPQRPHPPIWVAARDPGTFDWAVRQGCSVMTWALTRPFAEVETYMARFEASLAANPGLERPRFMTMRHTAIYGNPKPAASISTRCAIRAASSRTCSANSLPSSTALPRRPSRRCSPTRPNTSRRTCSTISSSARPTRRSPS